MLEYLAAIGLKEYTEENKLQRLISEIVSSPTNKYITNFKDKDSIKIEYEKKFNEKMSLIVRGNLSEQEELTVNFFMPIALSDKTIDIVEADVEIKDEEFLYYVYCEDDDTGTQIDFCLQNVMDYLDIEQDENTYIEGAQMMGLSVDGKVILNVDKDDVEKELELEEEQWRKELLKKARQGDMDAQELLEIEAEEMEDIIEERLEEEDLFSILEGFYMPVGVEQGLYSVLGTIEKIKTYVNSLTNEKVYNLTLNCIGVNFEVCINKKDLIGKPMKGMRFLGLCWMQGKLLFA